MIEIKLVKVVDGSIAICLPKVSQIIFRDFFFIISKIPQYLILIKT